MNMQTAQPEAKWKLSGRHSPVHWYQTKKSNGSVLSCSCSRDIIADTFIIFCAAKKPVLAGNWWVVIPHTTAPQHLHQKDCWSKCSKMQVDLMTERASNNLLVFDLRRPEPPVIRSHTPKEQKWLNKSMLAFPGTQHEARQSLSASSQRLPHITLCKRQTLDFSHTHYLAVLQILNATETACQAQPHTQHFLTLFSCPRNWHFGSAVPKGDFPSTSVECPA